MKKKSEHTILLVEDEIFIAMAQQQELEKQGYRTIHALSGAEAVSMAKKNNAVEMVLMDIDLGYGINGIEAAELILKDRELPVIFVSNNSEPNIIEKAKKVSDYGYITKNMNFSILNSTISSALTEFYDNGTKENTQTEEEPRIERDSLINIFSSMRDGVVIISKGKRIQYRNAAIKKTFSDLNGQKCYQYLYNRSDKCPWCKLENIIGGEVLHNEYESQINSRTYDVICSPIKNIDGSISMLEIMRDITIRKKVEQELKNQLAEKELILKETHHRIKNNLASIVSLLSMQINSLSNYSAIMALNDAVGRVKSMQILYEKLLLTENQNMTSIKEYLENLIDEIVSLCLFTDSIDVSVEKDIDDFQLEPKRLVSFGIIVNELLTNIMKYAFIGRPSGLIQITLKNNRGNIVLTIQDNGKGLPEGFDFEKETGFGLMLVRMLTEQLEGSFQIRNHCGTKSLLTFKNRLQ